MSTVNVKVSGPTGTGKAAIIMLIARAAANAGMRLTMPHAELDLIDEEGIRRLGPEALTDKLAAMAKDGMSLYIELEPYVEVEGEPLPPAGSTFKKEEFPSHPMAPADTPFAEPVEPIAAARESAKAEQVERVEAKSSETHMDGKVTFLLMLPDPRSPSGYSNARTEVPPGVIPHFGDDNTKADHTVEAVGGISLPVALASGYAWLAKNPQGPTPEIQRVAVQTVIRTVLLGDPISLELPVFPPYEG